MNFVNSYVMGDNDVKFYLEKERQQRLCSTRKIFWILKTCVPCSSKDFQSKRLILNKMDKITNGL